MKIIISGTTGVGKSTTVESLKKKLEDKGKKVIVKGELVLDSPYFQLYFNNLSEWGMLAQLDFLLERFRQYVSVDNELENLTNNTVVIFDRHFLEDLAFAELKWVRENTSIFLSNTYLVIYKELLKKLIFFKKIDYFILLKASFDTVMERMVNRGREIEQTFHEKYWQDLYYRYYSKKNYRKTFKEHTKHFVEIDTDDFNPDETANNIIKYIFKRSSI